MHQAVSGLVITHLRQGLLGGGGLSLLKIANQVLQIRNADYRAAQFIG